MPASSSIHASSEPALFALVLNWNSCSYTLACLESLLRSDYGNLTIIVCDNGSDDDSWRMLRAWAKGWVAAPKPAHPRLAALISTPRKHDPSSVFLEESQLEAAEISSGGLIAVRKERNTGYAAGNNVGLRLSLKLGADYIWILNNDTLVEPLAAAHLVALMRAHPEVGLCGCTLMEYERPDKVRTLAGSHFNSWTGRVSPVTSPSDVARRLCYVEGASLCTTRKFVEEVGLLCEDYFLYCEEIDWAIRAKPRYGLSWCPEARVYHKKGASADQSPVRDYFSARSPMLLARKHWPLRLFTMVPCMLGLALVHLLKGRPASAASVWRAIVSAIG